jgi:hypothetical protein
MKQLSDAIYDHLVKVAKSTKLDGKVNKGKKSTVTSATATAMTTSNHALVHLPGSPEEFVEINGHLFFFFHPATIVRWPKQGLEFKDFTVRIEPRVKNVKQALRDMGESRTKLTSLEMKCHGSDFDGDFWIDEDGTLHLIQPAAGVNPETGKPFGIDIVLLGNPGPEQGSNGPC